MASERPRLTHSSHWGAFSARVRDGRLTGVDAFAAGAGCAGPVPPITAFSPVTG